MLMSPHSYKHCGVTVVIINNIVLCPIGLIVVHIIIINAHIIVYMYYTVDL